ncbi:MAG: bifunctional precorrin-2 dehydrogenase/sirohydrochlorin ferrochelatase [Thermodesulfobacteriota bacterium]
MPELYPLFLRLEGRPCLVVGGGEVAGRKVRGLLAAGAQVTVVAPEAGDEVRFLAGNGRLRWVPRGFEPGDLEGMVLAFAATSDPEVNRQVIAGGAARGTWVNAADDPEASGFHVPAVHRRGGLAVAVATGGAVPALAAWVRDRIARELPCGLEELVEVARQLRESTPPSDPKRFRALFDSGILEDLARGDREAAQSKVAEVFGKGE